MSNGIVDLMSEAWAGVGEFYCTQISLCFVSFKSVEFFLKNGSRIALVLRTSCLKTNMN